MPSSKYSMVKIIKNNNNNNNNIITDIWYKSQHEHIVKASRSISKNDKKSTKKMNK